jgi:hypothetical protein
MQYKQHTQGLKLKPQIEFIKGQNTSHLPIFWLHFFANVNLCILTSSQAIYGIILKRNEEIININK